MYAKADLVTACRRLTQERLERWVEAGWIGAAPPSREPESFTELDRARADLICHLRDDLDINNDTVPLVLSMMDQIYSLRRDMRAIVQAIGGQPPDVRKSIAVAIRSASDTDH